MPQLISLDKSVYDAMYDEQKAARALIAALEAQLDAQTKLIAACDPSIPPKIAAMLRSALDVVSYGVANMDPLTFKGWPTGGLRAFAAAIREIPTAAHDDLERAASYDTFATEAEHVEGFRARGEEHLLGEPAKGLRAQLDELRDQLLGQQLRYERLQRGFVHLTDGKCVMDAPDGPTCWCGEPSAHESGACAGHGKKPLLEPPELQPQPKYNRPGI